MQQYTLMHRDIPVLDMKLRDEICYDVTRIHEPDHIPPGCKKPIIGNFNTRQFMQKWAMRSIPITRQNIKIAKENFPGILPQELALYSNFANLSDQYWVKPTGSEIKYQDISFFLNDFTSDFDQMLISSESIPSYKSNQPDITTPSCSTGGDMPKAWSIEPDKTRVLNKASSSITQQELLNETIATELNKLLGTNHIPYKLKIYQGVLCATCPCCIDQYHEIIPAYDILRDITWQNPVSKYPFHDVLKLIQFAESQGVQSAKDEISAMILTDYIMRNTDRHWTNFGMIRNAETLQYTGMLPLFDYGNSLFHNKGKILINQDAKSKLTGQTLFLDLKFITAYGRLNKLHTENLNQFPKIAAGLINNFDLSTYRTAMLIDVIKSRTKQACDYLDIELDTSERNLSHDIEYF